MELNSDSEIPPMAVGGRGEIVRRSEDSGSYRTPAGSVEGASALVFYER